MVTSFLRTALILNADCPLGQDLTSHLLSHSYNVIQSHSNLSLGHTLSATAHPNSTFLSADLSSWPGTVSLFKAANRWATTQSRASNQSTPPRRAALDLLVILPPESSSESSGAAALLQKLLALNVRLETDELQLESGPGPAPNLSAMTEATTQMLWGVRMFVSGAERQNCTKRVVVFGEGAELSGMPGMPVYSGATHAIVGLTRSLGAILNDAADIELNCILPAFVTRGSDRTVAKTANVMRAMDLLLEDQKNEMATASNPEAATGPHFGQVIEAAMKGFYFRRQADWPDEEQRWMGEERAAFFRAATNESTMVLL